MDLKICAFCLLTFGWKCDIIFDLVGSYDPSLLHAVFYHLNQEVVGMCNFKSIFNSLRSI
jgi:hypothetical protein